MDESLFERVWRVREQMLRSRPESMGTPIIDGFSITVLPPWSRTEESDILRIRVSGVGICCISPTYRSLLLAHTPDRNFPNRWDITSGHVDPDHDDSLAHAAARELLEETGIKVEPESLEPVSYAWKLRNKEKIGGVQYVVFADPTIPTGHMVDTEGRIIFEPPTGVDRNEVRLLALEPISVFMDANRSLLRQSKYPWVYSHLRTDLITRANRIIEYGSI